MIKGKREEGKMPKDNGGEEPKTQDGEKTLSLIHTRMKCKVNDHAFINVRCKLWALSKSIWEPVLRADLSMYRNKCMSVCMSETCLNA